MITWIEKENNILVSLKGFSLRDTLDCGQAFRWSEQEENTFAGIHKGLFLRVSQEGDLLTFYDTTKTEFETIWWDYFDFDTDYAAIREFLSFDPHIRDSYPYAGGIRMLKQDPWETLCSFIISQNNNIPRIKGIISRFCESFGAPMENGNFAFPSWEVIAGLGVDDLAPLRAGFRAKYLLDAAQKVASGEVDFSRITQMDLLDAQQELTKICGVGPKVAQCVLLFGFYKLDAFPVDVWIKKALDYFYCDGFPDQAKPFQGIAQQYLFHYIRHCDDAIPKALKK